MCGSMQLKGLGERCKLPSGVRGETHGRNCITVIFGVMETCLVIFMERGGLIR